MQPATVRWTNTARRADDGMTLLELMVTLSVAGVLMALGVGGMRTYLIATRESSTAQSVRSALRAAGEQAVSEGRTYCVLFTTTTWTLYRSDCTVAADKVDGPHQVDDPSITLTAVNFPPPSLAIPNENTSCPQSGHCAYFYPRGTALAGGLQVLRPGKTYTITVEGLTGRVSLA